MQDSQMILTRQTVGLGSSMPDAAWLKARVKEEPHGFHEFPSAEGTHPLS